MSFFCLLWVPLFYLFRRSFAGSGGSGGVWALILGSLIAAIQFFLGDIGSPGGFGLSRWSFGFFNIVSLPVILPLVLYGILCLFSGFSGDVDFANFALLFLIPLGAFRALGWSALSDPVLLVLVPLLWTALAVGIPFFINLILNNSGIVLAIVFILCILILPVLTASSYWAFFSQKTLMGIMFLFAANIPLGFSLFFDVSRA